MLAASGGKMVYGVLVKLEGWRERQKELING